MRGRLWISRGRLPISERYLSTGTPRRSMDGNASCVFAASQSLAHGGVRPTIAARPRESTGGRGGLCDTSRVNACVCARATSTPPYVSRCRTEARGGQPLQGACAGVRAHIDTPFGSAGGCRASRSRTQSLHVSLALGGGGARPKLHFLYSDCFAHSVTECESRGGRGGGPGLRSISYTPTAASSRPCGPHCAPDVVWARRPSPPLQQERGVLTSPRCSPSG